MTDLAAALLRDVPIRGRIYTGGRINTGGNCLDELVLKKDVLAALSRAMSDDLAERAVFHLLVLRDDLGQWSKQSADLITALLTANAALRAERDETYAYAKHLAEAMFANGKFDAPQWEPLEDTLGVLTQIDNMAAGIRARAEAAEAEVEKLREKIRYWEARIDDCEWATNTSLTEGIRAEMRAALSTTEASHDPQA